MDPLTIGVEEEFLVVDVATGALVPRAHDLLRAAVPSIVEDVAPELNLCQIETATPVCTGLAEVGTHLARLRAGLVESGRPHGVGILASGAHPVTSWRDQVVDVSNQRFQRMDDRFQIVARQQVICGCHVHVGIPDEDLAVATMSAVRPWLPVLLALSANSPFWQGTDTGFASYRMQIWSRWPTAVMPPVLDSRAEFDELVTTLASIDAIEDATFLYWHIRPSVRWPTVEFRVCDTLLEVDHAVAIAGLVRALAWTLAAQIERGVVVAVVRPEVIDAAMWRAGRYGLDDRLVSMRSLTLRPAAEVVSELLEVARPGLEAHDDVETVGALVAGILANGNGATSQRALAAERADLEEMARELMGRTGRAGAIDLRSGGVAPAR